MASIGWMVIPAGIEPATYRLGICRSILLSYGTGRVRHIAVSERFANRPAGDLIRIPDANT